VLSNQGTRRSCKEETRTGGINGETEKMVVRGHQEEPAGGVDEERNIKVEKRSSGHFESPRGVPNDIVDAARGQGKYRKKLKRKAKASRKTNAAKGRGWWAFVLRKKKWVPPGERTRSLW